jgi:hypothetical protein
MASLKDTVNLTTQLSELTNQLHGELTEGDVDFERMIEIADQISEHADNLAAAFTRVNEALAEPLKREDGAGGSNGSRSAGSRRRSASGSGSSGR